ncbi:MAG TPA: DUF2141 domain-containing protein [Caulobacteraceae bacterium]|nr:DUF2141 domain-containing protein [Caulobacteraceae bacterium]
MALASASLAHAQEGVCHGPPSNTRLMVTVDGVKNDKGQVAVVLYGDDQKKFLKQELMDTYDPAHAGSTTVCISLPHPGQYALVAYHDANSNKDLDTGLLGVPKEGYGFSNNVRPVLSAPSFNATHIVAAAGDNRLSVRLHYPGH